MLFRMLPAILVYGGMLWTGYQRRRGIWTLQSWFRFGLALSIAYAMFWGALAMGSGVDNGIYHGMSPFAHHLYFYTLMGLTLIATVVNAALIMHFARGNPRRQFGFSIKHVDNPRTMQQTEIRDQLHQAFVSRGFTLLAQHDDPGSYGSWSRDYARASHRVRIIWDSVGWLFTVEGGDPSQRIGARPGSNTVERLMAPIDALG